MRNAVFSKLDQLPRGQASGRLTPGCAVLEGGAFRGVYTSGVLDALMEADINLQCTVGVSAGALNGLNYAAGQIGRSGRINLRYRHDSRYVGRKAIRANHGLIGFDFVLEQLNDLDPFNQAAFDRPDRRFIAVAANCLTGQTEYFEKGVCRDIFRAVQASASMPYVSKPVLVDGIPCLDGGCTDKIPFRWAMEQGYEKIVVVRTRPVTFRKTPRKSAETLAHRVYRAHPAFAQALADSNRNYNRQCEAAYRLQQAGRIFTIAPSTPLTVGRLEKDMEKLGQFYFLGYRDAKKQIPALQAYLRG